MPPWFRRTNLCDGSNELNRQIVHSLPEVARAYATLHAHVPLLREMQSLLSQRPAGSGGGREFTVLQATMGKTSRMATQAASCHDLPTWSHWLQQYARAIDYSVRHIQRLVLGEEKKKTTKQCGWAVSDHNNLIRAATLAFDLVAAIEAGADTFGLLQEVKEMMDAVDEDLLSKPFEPATKELKKRPARQVTTDNG
jgi:hypothetical protein